MLKYGHECPRVRKQKVPNTFCLLLCLSTVFSQNQRHISISMPTGDKDDQQCPHCGIIRQMQAMTAENKVDPQNDQQREEKKDLTSVPKIAAGDPASPLDKGTQCTAVTQVTMATQWSDPENGEETSSESTDSSLRPIYAVEGRRRRRLIRRRREIARLWG